MSHWDFGQPTDHREQPPPLPFRDNPPAGNAASGDGGWSPAGNWGADGTWSAADAQSAASGPYAGDAYAGDAYAGTPVTGDEQWTDEYWDGPEGWSADDSWASPEGTGAYPITYERPDPTGGDPTGAGAATAGGGGENWPDAEDWRLPPAGGPSGQGRHGRQNRGPRRWLFPAGVAAVAAGVGVGAVLLTTGHPAARGNQQAGGFTAPSATASTSVAAAPASAGTGAAPLTMLQAQGVMAGYTEANNGANAQRDNTMLASVETGSSYAIDAGLYQMQRGIGAAPFPAFGPVRTAYYLPRGEQATGPRWFVVEVANAFFASPHKVSSTEYLLFTQAAPGGQWQNAVEPYVISGVSTPQLAVGSDGLATAVDPAATTFAAVPGQLPQLTAASLDGTGSGVANPGNVSDLGDEHYWRGKLPNATVTDTHAVTNGAEGQVHALLTTDGGALVFYTDAAELTITPPAGTALHLTVPGFYSPAQALTRAGVSYLEQFAVYDPSGATATASPRVVADYSGITGKN